MWQARGPSLTFSHSLSLSVLFLLERAQKEFAQFMSRKQKIPEQNGREIKQLVHGILPAYRQPEVREG